jgi:hypothetical protein
MRYRIMHTIKGFPHDDVQISQRAGDAAAHRRALLIREESPAGLTLTSLGLFWNV